MKSKKTLLGVALATMLLTGCGGGDKPVDPKTSEGPAPTTSQKTSTPTKTSTAPVVTIKHNVTINGGETTEVAYGSAIAKPADPTAPAGKKFYGWQNTLNGGQIWNFDREDLNVVMQDVNLEPVFVDAALDAQILEAELCPDITAVYGEEKGMKGATYSGGQQGKGLIGFDYYDELGVTGVKDEEGFDTLAFVHFMYVKGDTLTWEVESSAAAENVVIFARYSAEYGIPDPERFDEKKCGVTDTSFPITVNGEACKYGSITFHNIPNIGQFLSFQDYLVSASVSLKAGTNIIQMKVDNEDTLNGTIASSAPCVDSIKIFSSSTITWNEAKLSNLSAD